MGAINMQTGELRWISAEDVGSYPLSANEVMVTGSEEDIRAIATDVQQRVSKSHKKSKRKAQRAARKANR